MIFIHLALFVIVLILCIIRFKLELKWAGLLLLIGLALLAVVVMIDQSAQTTDTEVWSGTVVDWDHDEEYDETVTDYDSKGNVSGYHTVHHDADNHIKTSDGGWISVSRSPDGRKFNDSWPNKASELKQMWPEGTPTASTHTYENKVQASYSIYRHKEIDLKQYKDLPKYPKETYDYIYIDRVIGDFPNELAARRLLDKWNTELNKFIPDPEKPGKKRSWKQVNIIFVNVGHNKPIEYGYALQDYWEGGNKNDFIVSMSLQPDGEINWVYPFSLSEVEILKIEVRDLIYDMAVIKDSVPIVDKVSQLVADKFVRKQFADYSYLQIETSTAALIVLWILFVIYSVLTVIGCISENESSNKYYRSNRYYR